MSVQSEKTPSTGLQSSDKKPLAENTLSTPISASLAEHLFKLAKQVTQTQVTPETIRAACNCATEIHKLLDLQLRAKIELRKSRGEIT